MLITEEYRYMNAEMHQRMPNYGTGFKFNPESLTEFCSKLKTTDVLDYGCGKGGLGKSGWLPFQMKLYDPCIPEFSQRPDPAELVLCLDVMEHVEPECLNDVIKDLYRVTEKVLIVSVALAPSSKLLPNGQNSHISLYTLEEWALKFKLYFDITLKTIEKDDLTLGWLYCKPRLNLLEMGPTEELFAPMDGEPVDLMCFKMVEFGEHMPINFFPAYQAYALAMMNEWFTPDLNVEMKEERIALVGYGPSLVDSWEEIKKYKTIFTCSGAHKLLLEKGIVPTYHVEIDWKPHKPKFTAITHPDTIYIVSSICNPGTIDNIKNRKSKIFFVDQGEQVKHPLGAVVLDHGYDVGQQTMVIARLLGYKNIDLFGFDYCFNLEMVRHAGEHGGRVHNAFPAKVGNKIFYTSKTMFTALLVFEHLYEKYPEMDIRSYGDTLLLNFMEERARMAEKEIKNGECID